jgi:hypothetical protein
MRPVIASILGHALASQGRRRRCTVIAKLIPSAQGNSPFARNVLRSLLELLDVLEHGQAEVRE